MPDGQEARAGDALAASAVAAGRDSADQAGPGQDDADPAAGAPAVVPVDRAGFSLA